MTRVQRSLQLWQLLIGAARLRQTLTYSMAADIIGMGAGTLSQPLDLVMRYCHQNGLPPLTVLVVNQETGQPGSGLSTLEELNRDRERVFNYQWFRLPPLRAEDLAPQGTPGEDDM
jgi:putative restriction endonuclease